MRRPAISLLTLLFVTALAVSVAQPAGAASPPATTAPPQSGAAPTAPLPGTQPDDQPPRGATDGIPVGGDDIPHGPVTMPSIKPHASPNAVTQRYFGSGPWAAIATDASSASKCAGLSSNELKAMMVSPVFGESSGGTTASSAPSPMTLSRYDEWSGTYGTNSNSNANYGLYAFRNPNTTYKRAFWNPGIGIWQYDPAGVGAPFTAAESMNVAIVAADVASGMVDRWCNPGPWIGTHASYTAAQRRAAGWAPWWYTENGVCPACEQAYQDMNPDSSTPFANIHQVSMSTTGGAVQRSCRLNGTSYPCWYIDPNAAQGSSWWASLTPLDGGSPTVAPTPIAAPFYVIKRNGLEQRYWLKADTGYVTDISGTRVLGKNARPRSSQSGSGITWTNAGGFCDVTAYRGDCGVPNPPSGVTSTLVPVSGTYQPVMFDANGDGHTDVFWYAPGAAADSMWLGHGGTSFSVVPERVIGSGYTVLAGNFDGDKYQDLLFYTPSGANLHLWLSRGDGTFSTQDVPVGVGLLPIVLDQNGNGRDEIFMYGVGARADHIVEWNGKSFGVTSTNVAGTYQPYVGDFDGNFHDDIFWYAPGSGADSVWLSTGNGGHISVPVTVNGNYSVAVGDVDNDGKDDIAFKDKSNGNGWVWFGAARGAFTQQRVNGAAGTVPVMADLLGDGRDDLLYVGNGAIPDQWSRWSATRTRTSSALSLTGTQRPYVGGFSAGNTDGIFWYGPGSETDYLWHH
ncbi:MAG: FG-GAP-like repeat-containing protein [Nakamurella sp.]